MITIDITKAKEVWKDKIRFKRGKALKKLDYAIAGVHSSLQFISTTASLEKPLVEGLVQLNCWI